MRARRRRERGRNWAPEGGRRRRRSKTLTPLFRPTEKQELLCELVGHEGRITRCAWGPLNRTLLSTGEDGSVRLWDVEVRRPRSRVWRERCEAA